MANHELISQIAKVKGQEGISQASPKVEVAEGVSLNWRSGLYFSCCWASWYFRSASRASAFNCSLDLPSVQSMKMGRFSDPVVFAIVHLSSQSLIPQEVLPIYIKLHIKHMFRNNACRTCVAGILLPHNANPRLRLVTYPCHWTKDREADVVAYIRIGKMAWAVDVR